MNTLGNYTGYMRPLLGVFSIDPSLQMNGGTTKVKFSEATHALLPKIVGTYQSNLL